MSAKGFSIAELNEIRQQFPILASEAHGHPLVYLDNAATTQRPECVVKAVEQFYRESNANVHRGVHYLSEKATALYEAARQTIANHLHVDARELIFTKGTTESINLVATCMDLKPGDEVLISALEHHANIVPWQQACQRSDAVLKVIPINELGEIDEAAYELLLSPRTKLVAITHTSNAIGTKLPLTNMIAKAKAQGALVLVDGAQALPHESINVKALGCDFFAASAHKAYGPTGVGLLYGRYELLDQMPPYQGGGDMIVEVSFESSRFQKPPVKFEAGTPNIAGVIGFARAIEFINDFGLDRIKATELVLSQQLYDTIDKLPTFNIIGRAKQRTCLVSFTHETIHPHDIGTILDQHGVAVRAGHHCAMPLMEVLGVPATVRASLSFYNTEDEIVKLSKALQEVVRIFA